MKKTDFGANKYHNFEDMLYYDLFSKFKQEFSNSVLVRRDRIIPFPTVFAWFSFLKYRKKEVKQILREIEKRNLLKIVAFHGVIIR